MIIYSERKRDKLKKILITGGSGFIGRNLKELLQDSYYIKAPAHNELDMLDSYAVSDYLKKERFDVVIHSANINTTRNKENSAYDSLNGNLQMFFQLEKNSGLFGKMLYFGSGAEYDMDHYAPGMKEEFFGTFIPKDPYGFSKYIMAKHTEYLDNVYDLRLFGVYGKYEEWERRFISNTICRILNGGPIVIHQNVVFDYLWVEDLSDIVKWFIEHKPAYRHYNVCSGRRTDLLSLAQIIKDVMHASCDIIVENKMMKREYTGDNGRLLKEMGKISFSDYEKTIIELVRFYQGIWHTIDRSGCI